MTGVHVFVRSLGSADPTEAVEVQLVSRANAVLATGTTDAQGYVRFDAGLARGQGGAAPAMIVARKGDDLSFLPLTDPEFDLSDRGVEGREPAQPIDVFLTTDRGIYRAGEVVNATVLARDPKAEALSGLPVTAVLTRPDGVEYTRVLADADKQGGYVFNLPVSGNAPRGTWRLDIYSDPKAPSLASERFLVEDFLPERIDFDIAVPEGILPADEPVPLSVDARYLFGAPGRRSAGLGPGDAEPDRQPRRLAGLPLRPLRPDRLAEHRFDPRGHAPTRTAMPSSHVDLPELDESTAPLQRRVRGSGRRRLGPSGRAPGEPRHRPGRAGDRHQADVRGRRGRRGQQGPGSS